MTRGRIDMGTSVSKRRATRIVSPFEYTAKGIEQMDKVSSRANDLLEDNSPLGAFAILSREFRKVHEGILLCACRGAEYADVPQMVRDGVAKWV